MGPPLPLTETVCTFEPMEMTTLCDKSTKVPLYRLDATKMGPCDMELTLPAPSEFHKTVDTFESMEFTTIWDKSRKPQLSSTKMEVNDMEFSVQSDVSEKNVKIESNIATVHCESMVANLTCKSESMEITRQNSDVGSSSLYLKSPIRVRASAMLCESIKATQLQNDSIHLGPAKEEHSDSAQSLFMPKSFVGGPSFMLNETSPPHSMDFSSLQVKMQLSVIFLLKFVKNSFLYV